MLKISQSLRICPPAARRKIRVGDYLSAGGPQMSLAIPAPLFDWNHGGQNRPSIRPLWFRRVDSAILIAGTILDPSSMQAHLVDRFPDSAATVTSQWRRYQLEYSWRATCQETYEPFESITRKALVHALSECDEHFENKDIDWIMQKYETLDMYAPC